jgi:hypothetical protein
MYYHGLFATYVSCHNIKLSALRMRRTNFEVSFSKRSRLEHAPIGCMRDAATTPGREEFAFGTSKSLSLTPRVKWNRSLSPTRDTMPLLWMP